MIKKRKQQQQQNLYYAKLQNVKEINVWHYGEIRKYSQASKQYMPQHFTA